MAPRTSQAVSTPLRPQRLFATTLLPPAAFLSDTGILGSSSSTVLGTPARSLGASTYPALSPSILHVPREGPLITGPNPATPLLGAASSLPASAHSSAGDALLASVTGTPLGRPIDSPFQPSYNSNEGFDVMDFLDSILSEGNNAAPPEASGHAPYPFLSANAAPISQLSSVPVHPVSSTSCIKSVIILSAASVVHQCSASVVHLAAAIVFFGSLGDGAVTSVSLWHCNRRPRGNRCCQGVDSAWPLNTAAVLYADEIHEDDDDDDGTKWRWS